MKANLTLVVEIIRNSTWFKVNLIEYSIEPEQVILYSKKSMQLNCTDLVGVISGINSVGCYLNYNHELDKVVLIVF
jgi:hypothetical protein